VGTARSMSWLVLCALAALALPRAASPALAQDAAPALADGATALSTEARRIAEEVPDEGTPDPGEHYPVSNEWRHDLWFPHVRDLGGAFVGVGSDQCYTLAAIQDARIAWMIDFDPMVPLVHRMYSVLVPRSETPEALVARFEERSAAATRALLLEHLAGDERVARMFDRHRARWLGYLTRVSRLRRDGAPTSWLSDPVLYARVRAMFVGGRIIARNGDVTGERTLRAIGSAARRLGEPVRVVYFSNAEQFFPYSSSVLANVRALPTDERTVLLRTFRDRNATYPAGDRWHYVVHRFGDFLDRVENAGYGHLRHIVADLVGGRRPARGDDGLTIIDASTPRRARSTVQ
jgi:hypothetical protein